MHALHGAAAHRAAVAVSDHNIISTVGIYIHIKDISPGVKLARNSGYTDVDKKFT